MGIRGCIFDWFSSYLRNRTQCVSVLGALSERRVVKCGVPQGSIIGPLLFLLYINDMSKSSNNFQFVHYADDTSVHKSGPDLSSLIDDINLSFHGIDAWLISNKLSLNVGKSVFMIFSHLSINFENPVTIRGRPLKCVTSKEFLGVVIDNKLNFSEHISFIAPKNREKRWSLIQTASSCNRYCT